MSTEQAVGTQLETITIRQFTGCFDPLILSLPGSG